VISVNWNLWNWSFSTEYIVRLSVMNGVWSSVCLCGNCGGGCCCWYFAQQNTVLKRENYKLV